MTSKKAEKESSLSLVEKKIVFVIKNIRSVSVVNFKKAVSMILLHKAKNSSKT